VQRNAFACDAVRFGAPWTIGLASPGKARRACFQDILPGPEGRRHAPLVFLKVVISTANSAMIMIVAIMTVRPFVADGCATGAGLLRCCGSSASGQRSRIVKTGSAVIAAMLLPHARKSSGVKVPLDVRGALRSTISGFTAGFGWASGSSEIDACAFSGLGWLAERTLGSGREVVCAA